MCNFRAGPGLLDSVHSSWSGLLLDSNGHVLLFASGCALALVVSVDADHSSNRLATVLNLIGLGRGVRPLELTGESLAVNL